jgi:hypothetical protein
MLTDVCLARRAGLVWRRSVLAAASGIAIIFGFLHGAAFGAEPVAMVMQIIGETDPALREGDLLADGRQVILERDTRITFFIFGECGLFTATHGTVTFLRREAKSDSDTLLPGPGPCTKVYDLREPGEPVVGGGLTLRHGDLPLRVPARPEFLLGGLGAVRIVGAQLTPEDGESRTPRTMVLAGGKLTLETPTLLLNNHGYTLTFSVSSGARPQGLSLEVTSDAPPGLLEVLIVN